MTQRATVVKVLNSEMAEIMVPRVSACGGNCASCGGCGDKKCVIASAYNDINAKEGDTVIVESGTSRIIAIAAIVYMLPLVFLLAAYIITVSLGLKENMSIIISIISFSVGVGVVVVASRTNKIKRAEFHIKAFAEGIN